MYIMCVILCLFSALSRRVGALQISIIIISQQTNDDSSVVVRVSVAPKAGRTGCRQSREYLTSCGRMGWGGWGGGMCHQQTKYPAGPVKADDVSETVDPDAINNNTCRLRI